MENTSQENPMAQPPLEPLARQKHLPPKVWVPILVVVALIVAYLGIASAYDIWPFASSDERLATSEQGDTDQIASWKTYRNQEFGFEVKYPSNLNIVKEGENIFLEHNKYGKLYSLTLIDNPYNLSPEHYVNVLKSVQANKPEGTSFTSQKKIFVNGIEGIDAEIYGAGSFQTRSVYFQAKKKIVNIQYGINVINIYFNDDEEAYENYLENGNKIISSFRTTFLRSSKEISINWDEAVRLIRDCKVVQISQAHSMKVWLYSEDGTEYISQEPQIDLIIREGEDASKKCGYYIMISTE